MTVYDIFRRMARTTNLRVYISIFKYIHGISAFHAFLKSLQEKCHIKAFKKYD